MVPSAIPGAALGFMARRGRPPASSPEGMTVAGPAEDLRKRFQEADQGLVASRAVGQAWGMKHLYRSQD
jgi:hypothetical protein